MSFSRSSNTGKGSEWNSNNQLLTLFAQKQNVVNPFSYQMIRELVRYKDDVFRYLEKLQEKDGASVQENETLGEFPDSDKYSQKSRECYLDSNEIQTCDLLGFDSYGSYRMTSDDHYVAACAV
ncbi:unnamed protein product [Sphagnum balticum]